MFVETQDEPVVFVPGEGEGLRSEGEVPLSRGQLRFRSDMTTYRTESEIHGAWNINIARGYAYVAFNWRGTSRRPVLSNRRTDSPLSSSTGKAAVNRLKSPDMHPTAAQPI